MGYDLERFTCEVSPTLKCPICRKIYENPVQVDCSGGDKDVQHIFCRACLIETFASSDRLKCPIDGKLFKRNTRRSLFLIPPQELFDTLSSLPIKCSFSGCMMSIKLGDLESHIEICQFNPNRNLNDLMDPSCIGNFLNQTNSAQANQNQSWFMDIEPWNPDHEVTNAINHGSSSSMSSNIMGTPSSGNSILPMTSNTHQTSVSIQSSPDYGRIDCLFSRIESKMDDRFNHIMKILNHDGTKGSKKLESLLQKQIDDLKKWKESTTIKFDEQLRKHTDSIIKHLPGKEVSGPTKKQRNRHDSKKESDNSPVTSEIMRKEMKELKNSLETHFESKTGEMKEINESASERLTVEVQKVQQNLRKDMRKDQIEMRKNLEKELAAMRKELKKFSDPKSVDLKPFDNLEKKIQQTNAILGNQIKEIKNSIKSHNTGLKNVANQLKNISLQIESEFKQLATIEEEKSDNQDTSVDPASTQDVKRRRRSSRLNPDSICSDEDLVEYGPPKPRERRPTRLFGPESSPPSLIPLENQSDLDPKLSITTEKNELEVKENSNSSTTNKPPTITNEIKPSEKVSQTKDNSSSSDSLSIDKNQTSDSPEQSNTRNSNDQESQLPVTTTASTTTTTVTTSTSISSSISISSTSTLTPVEPIKVSTIPISNNNNNNNIITIDSTKLAQSWCSSSGIKNNTSTTTISLASPVAASVPLSSVLKPMSSDTSSKSKDTDLLAQIVNEVLFKDNMANNNNAESTSVWPTNSGQRTTFVRPMIDGRTSNLLQSSDPNRRVSDTILLAITRPVPGQPLRLGRSVTDTLMRPLVGTTFTTSSPLTNPSYSTARNSSVTIHSITPLPRELQKSSPPPPPPPTPVLTSPKKIAEEEEKLTTDKFGNDKLDLKSVMSLLFNPAKLPEEKSSLPASVETQPVFDSKPGEISESKHEGTEEKPKSPPHATEKLPDPPVSDDVTETLGDQNQTKNDSVNQNAREPETSKDLAADESVGNEQAQESVEQATNDVEVLPGKLEDKIPRDSHEKEGIPETPKIIIKKGAIRKRRKKKRIVKRSDPKAKNVDQQLPLLNAQSLEEITLNHHIEEPCLVNQDEVKPLGQDDETMMKDDKLQVRKKRGRPKGRKALKKSIRPTIIRASDEVSSPVIPRIKRIVKEKDAADETNISEAGVITRLRSGSKVIAKKSSTIKRHNVRSIALKKFAKSSVKISQATSKSQSVDIFEPIPRVKVINNGSNDFVIHNSSAPVENHPHQMETLGSDITQHPETSSDLIAKDTDTVGLAVKRRMPSRRGRKCKRRRKDKTLKSKAISNSGLLCGTQGFSHHRIEQSSENLNPSESILSVKSGGENFPETKSSNEKESSHTTSLAGKCRNVEDSLNFMPSIHKPIQDEHGEGSNDSTLIFSESSTRANSISDEDDLSEFEMIQSHLNSIIDMIDAELQDELKGDDEPCQHLSLNLTNDVIKELESG
ncbi:uncharacterized protein LOC141855560 [Brevipalpus obovatus]|uniref:uncharacterized protein LOC141855560 n=1 Tax=Brevipalpus obovatus TaxID=246614 RepID=UPI003D9E428F